MASTSLRTNSPLKMSELLLGTPLTPPQRAQAEAIRRAERVSNPGCYATGAIALLRPLLDAFAKATAQDTAHATAQSSATGVLA